jgi:hypothetical protein
MRGTRIRVLLMSIDVDIANVSSITAKHGCFRQVLPAFQP